MKNIKTFEGFFDFFKKDKTEDKPELSDQEFTENLLSKIKKDFNFKNFTYKIRWETSWYEYKYQKYKICVFVHDKKSEGFSTDPIVYVKINDHEMNLNWKLTNNILEYFKSKTDEIHNNWTKEKELDKKNMKRL